MAILGVGIFNGVVITATKYNKSEQGQSLDVTFKKAGAVSGSDNDLDFLNSGEVSSSDEGKENNIRIYGVNMQGYDGTTKDGDTLLNEVLARKDQLAHIASAYMTVDKIKFDLVKGVKATSKAELVKAITLEANLFKITENLFTQFEAMMAPVIGEDSKHVVVKFLRKSKASNFPRLADKKIDWNPFIAAEDDKALVAKLVFSKWEKDNGYDSNAQSLESPDATADDIAAQTEAVNNVFG